MTYLVTCVVHRRGLGQALVPERTVVSRHQNKEEAEARRLVLMEENDQQVWLGTAPVKNYYVKETE